MTCFIVEGLWTNKNKLDQQIGQSCFGPRWSYCRLGHGNVTPTMASAGVRICSLSWFLPPVEDGPPFFLVTYSNLLWTECWKPEDGFPYLNQRVNVFCFVSMKVAAHSRFILHQVYQLMSFHFIEILKVSCIYRCSLGNFLNFLRRLFA